MFDLLDVAFAAQKVLKMQNLWNVPVQRELKLLRSLWAKEMFRFQRKSFLLYFEKSLTALEDFFSGFETKAFFLRMFKLKKEYFLVPEDFFLLPEALLNYWDQENQLELVEFECAYPLSRDEQDQIERSLEKAWNQKIDLFVKEKRDLKAGWRLRVRSVTCDLSLKNFEKESERRMQAYSFLGEGV